MAEVITILVQLALVSVALGVSTAMVAEALEYRVPAVGRRRSALRRPRSPQPNATGAPVAARARARQRIA
ncbi:MAG: hypothetical protein U5Q44_03500 [Dehalococcoidia bacterium]|nr:hypothetical protein [Dehalococcoidia bacterium]